MKCEWCAGSDCEDPANLCEDHEAEYEGLSVNELRRMKAEQAEDLL